MKNLKNLSQVTFWLSFLQSRIPPVEPLGDCGRSVLTFFILFKCSLSPFSFSSSVHFHFFHSLQVFTFIFFILFKCSLSHFRLFASVHFHLFHSLQVFTSTFFILFKCSLSPFILCSSLDFHLCLSLDFHLS